MADSEGGRSSGPDPLATALAQAVRKTGASMGCVYVLTSRGRQLRPAVLTGVPRKVAAPWGRVASTDPLPTAEAVREQRLVWVGNRTELARHYPRAAVLLPYHFALAAAPITTGPTRRGALMLLWPGHRPAELHPDERELVDATCTDLGRLLRQWAQADAHRRPGGEPHVLTPPPGPTGALAAEDFLTRLPHGCCALDPQGRITHLNTTAAGLLGKNAQDLLGSLLWEALPWLDDPVFEDRYRAALISHQATTLTAVRPPGRTLIFEFHPDPSGVSAVITPADGATRRHQPERESRTRLPAGAGSLYDLMRLAATLTEAVSVRDVVEMAADQVMPAVHAQGFVISVAEGGRLRIVGSRGYRRQILQLLDLPPFRDRDAPSVRALTTGEPLFFASPEEMERIAPDIPRLTGRKAWAFLPLIASGNPVGCCVVSFNDPRSFPADERAVLGSLAGLIAQALDRARLYDAKLRLARGLQSGLLPAGLPSVPGLEVAARYLPAARGQEIGGDFYDLIRLDETNVAAVIGDVQGHSVEAAALMGQVRTAVHATAGAPPGEVLGRTNRLLTDLDTGLFTSCVYAHLDLAGSRVYLSSAGHPPPLLRHPDGRVQVLDLPPGLLLGIDPAADYPTTQLPLHSGDVLTMYTDGLVETPETDLDEAIAGLAGRLTRSRRRSAGALADTLLPPTRHRSLLSDDIALLVVSLRPPGRDLPADA